MLEIHSNILLTMPSSSNPPTEHVWYFDADDNVPNTSYLVDILQLFDFGSFLSCIELYNCLWPSHTTYYTVRVTEVEAYGTDDGMEIAIYRPYSVRP